MADMVLGAETITRAPNRINRVIEARREVASVKTFTSVAVFSWGAALVGEVIIMDWDYMPCPLFDTLQSLYVADNEVLFNPEDGTERTFQVEIMGFDGLYHQARASTVGGWRKTVHLELLITVEN